MKPLEGILVLEFAQFMAGPTAGLKLADLGARVIKIERPGKGEGGRQIAIKNLFVDGDSLVFHTINRNKESYAADLKDPKDLKKVKQLIAKADVMTHNFRPGVMEKIGLTYDAACKINPQIIYGVVTGYGKKGPWANKPGQDLLIQAMSGLSWLSGTKSDGPVPFGLAVADMACGAHLTQGILAALLKRNKTRKSALVEVSLLESTLDLQFELLTTFLNDGGKLPKRSAMRGSGHAYLSAPYGVYQTSDGYLTLAMGDLMKIGTSMGCDLTAYQDRSSWFEKRDAIISKLGKHFRHNSTEYWRVRLEKDGIWCSSVLNYRQALDHEAFRVLEMTQEVILADGKKLTTTRNPIRINGEKLYATKAAPKVGEDTDDIVNEFNIV
ncbi:MULTISPECIES: CaiB/BaiF CoA transferase family protein [Olivibacter]|jgi:crotonobetainyl-CoA:carnitine CoA-transferase CaiB-like acyl-CoA transferase|uniref:CaiB/BaiF CoA transferase family protein n=1 Tax=Olivibacter oleidegradans TaxID=760123 RepID=A0ABV6HRH0_9SPHI|nr:MULTISPECIES: CaiB/BaiF CoA-transferase family protein [Olivibacter]MDM8176120.1 CaiB/BaiF CoA-transferase family protein [Olivibacter sp. 47]QEL00885.1 CoA transferase [Olivibacter sp. LS-1]